MSLDPRPVIAVVVLVASAAAAHAQPSAPAALAGLSRDVACATMSPAVRPAAALTIVGGREIRRILFGPGDSVIVRGGAAQGVRVGDEYFVRRIIEDRYMPPGGGKAPIGVHTAGVVRILEAGADRSVAVVTEGCDGIADGDYLERFTPPALPGNGIGTSPDFSAPGRVIVAAERRQLGAPGAFMVLNRGSDHGVQAGQLLTVFRTSGGPSGPVTTIGTAKVHLVLPQSSTIRIETSVDAVYVGDLVAVHR